MVMSPSINSGEPPVALKKAVCAGRITLAQLNWQGTSRAEDDPEVQRCFEAGRERRDRKRIRVRHGW
jgi:hypothetical protein